MSFEEKLNERLLSEASLDDVRVAAAKRGITKKPQSPKDFAAVRKAIRQPMVNLDAAIHQIDQFLNVTQKDPSQLGSTVSQIEQSFNALFEPLRAVRSGIADLRKAADTFKADFDPQATQQNQQARQAQQATAKQPAQGAQSSAGVDEDRFLNRIATDIELANRKEDKAYAAKQGWEAYSQQGGKMNRGEFFRALYGKLQLPGDQPEQRKLPAKMGRQFKPQGQRTGELQFRPTRTSPIESSAQRRKMVQEAEQKVKSPNKASNKYHYTCAKCKKPVSTHESWHSKKTGKQYHHKCMPQESFAQRLDTIQEAGFGAHGNPTSYDPVISKAPTKPATGPNKQYSLGKLPEVPNEDRLINKVVTEIEMVNNMNDKKSAFRNGWLDYQSAGGALSHTEFVRAVTNKLKQARSLPESTQHITEMMNNPETDTYEFEVSDDYELMTVEDFVAACRSGRFGDFDGYGRPVKDGLMSDTAIEPDELRYIPDDATHIAWRYSR